MVEITFTDAAIDDLRRIGPDVAPRALKKVLILLDDPEAGYPLGGDLTGYRKLVVGRNTWRVAYRIVDDKSVEVCEVWPVGARADAEVYAQATARLRDARRRSPEFHQLAEVVERLGRMSADLVVPEPVVTEPVPDWLAERLVYTVGMEREAVAALGLEEAVDLWAGFMSRPR